MKNKYIDSVYHPPSYNPEKEDELKTGYKAKWNGLYSKTHTGWSCELCGFEWLETSVPRHSDDNIKFIYPRCSRCGADWTWGE